MLRRLLRSTDEFLERGAAGWAARAVQLRCMRRCCQTLR